MSNIRLFYSESLSNNLYGKLNKDQSKYLTSVMRLKINEENFLNEFLYESTQIKNIWIPYGE